MSWDFAPDIDSGHRATLAAGRSFIYVAPPAWWTTGPLFAQLPPAEKPGPCNLVIVPEVLGVASGAALLRSVRSLGKVHGVSGLSRTSRLLAQNIPDTLVGTPADLLRLISRSSLDGERVRRVVVGWPELLLDEEAADMTDSILAEFGGKQRVVITTDESAIKDFVERHARRSPMASASPPLEHPAAAVRYAVTSALQLATSVRAALDIINPATTLIWDPTPKPGERWQEYEGDPTVLVDSGVTEDPVDLAIAAELPTGDALEHLVAVSGEVLVMLQSHQVSYLESLVERARTFRLPSDADRARDSAARLREEVRDRIEDGSGWGALLALGPLFDEFDPATVAAALAARTPPAEQRSGGNTAVLAAWVRIRLTAGSRDRVRTGDVVGALHNAVGISKDQIGRVEVRDTHSVVDVRADVAERVLRDLAGVVLRGKRVTARIDRH